MAETGKKGKRTNLNWREVFLPLWVLKLVCVASVFFLAGSGRKRHSLGPGRNISSTWLLWTSTGGTDGALSSYTCSLHFLPCAGGGEDDSRETVAWVPSSPLSLPPDGGGQRLSAQITSDHRDPC